MKGLWVRVATMVVGTTVAQMNTEISGVREDKNLPTAKKQGWTFHHHHMPKHLKINLSQKESQNQPLDHNRKFIYLCSHTSKWTQSTNQKN